MLLARKDKLNKGEKQDKKYDFQMRMRKKAEKMNIGRVGQSRSYRT